MIVQYPAASLVAKAHHCTQDEGLRVAEQLLDAAVKPPWGNCMGFAAPQLGIDARVFVAVIEWQYKAPREAFAVYINPVIIWRSKVKKTYYEGCYSLGQHEEYELKRSNSIKMAWCTKNGEGASKRFYGTAAQIIQHEYDHLEGLLINRGKALGTE